MSDVRAYSPEFKAKVVLEAIRDQKSTPQICREHDISEDLFSGWKQAFLHNSTHLFTFEEGFTCESPEQRMIEELEELVGKLTHKLELSKRRLKFVMRVLSVRKEVDSTIARK